MGETVSLRITLRYKDLEEFATRFAENISSAGIFLRTRTPKPAGTKVRFELSLADGSPALVGEGVVVTVRNDDKPGMALRFNALEGASKDVVQRVVEQFGEGALAPTPLHPSFRRSVPAPGGWRRSGLGAFPPPVAERGGSGRWPKPGAKLNERFGSQAKSEADPESGRSSNRRPWVRPESGSLADRIDQSPASDVERLQTADLAAQALESYETLRTQPPAPYADPVRAEARDLPPMPTEPPYAEESMHTEPPLPDGVEVTTPPWDDDKTILGDEPMPDIEHVRSKILEARRQIETPAYAAAPRRAESGSYGTPLPLMEAAWAEQSEDPLGRLGSLPPLPASDGLRFEPGAAPSNEAGRLLDFAREESESEADAEDLRTPVLDGFGDESDRTPAQTLAGRNVSDAFDPTAEHDLGALRTEPPASDAFSIDEPEEAPPDPLARGTSERSFAYEGSWDQFLPEDAPQAPQPPWRRPSSEVLATPVRRDSGDFGSERTDAESRIRTYGANEDGLAATPADSVSVEFTAAEDAPVSSRPGGEPFERTYTPVDVYSARSAPSKTHPDGPLDAERVPERRWPSGQGDVAAGPAYPSDAAERWERETPRSVPAEHELAAEPEAADPQSFTPPVGMTAGAALIEVGAPAGAGWIAPAALVEQTGRPEVLSSMIPVALPSSQAVFEREPTEPPPRAPDIRADTVFTHGPTEPPPRAPERHTRPVFAHDEAALPHRAADESPEPVRAQALPRAPSLGGAEPVGFGERSSMPADDAPLVAPPSLPVPTVSIPVSVPSVPRALSSAPRPGPVTQSPLPRPLSQAPVRPASRVDSVPRPESNPRPRAGSGAQLSTQVSVRGVSGSGSIPPESDRTRPVSRPPSSTTRPPPSLTRRPAVERDTSDLPNRGSSDLNRSGDLHRSADVHRAESGAPAPRVPSTLAARAQSVSALPPDARSEIIGVDLGSQLLRLAMLDRGRVRFLTFDGQPFLPARVALTLEGALVSGFAAEEVAAQYPERAISVRPLLTALSADGLKPALLESHQIEVVGPENVQVAEAALALSDILAALLMAVREAARRELGIEKPRLLIGWPQNNSDRARERVEQVAATLGIEIVEFVPEVTAALVAYQVEERPVDTLLLFDLGAGHLGLSIARRGRDGFAHLQSSWDDGLSVRAFDERIADLALEQMASEWGEDRRRDPQFRAALLDRIARLRPELRTEGQIELAIEPSWLSGPVADPVIRMAGSRVEQATKDLVAQILERVRNILGETGIHPRALGTIVLGGQAGLYRPLVRELISFTGRTPLEQIRPAELLTVGLATRALQHEEQAKRGRLVAAIGIGLPGGRVRPLIAADTALPARVSRSQQTTRDNQTELDVTLYQGASELVAECRLLGKVALEGLPKQERGLAVKVDIELDADGVIVVTLSEAKSGRKVRFTAPTRQTSNERRQEILQRPALEDLTDPNKGGGGGGGKKGGGLLGRLFGR